MNDEPHRPSLMDLVTKGEELLKGRPFCDKMLNDQTALVFLAKMQEQGIEVSVEMAEQCFRRMQIAIDTGIYPDALLRRVVSSEQRLDGMVGSPDVLTDR